MFLTSTKRNAESGNIADYVTFVTGRAAAGHASIRPYSADFRPVISTDGPSNIHATTVISYVTDPNVPADAPGRVPVYWLNGAKVADNSQDFFDNSWDSHAARSESGTAYTVNNTTLHDLRAWTGSTHWGGRNYSAGNPNPRTGILRAGDEIEYDQRPRDKHHRLYAMSPVFTVDRTRARATFGVSERFGNWRGCGGDVYYNPYYLSGPSVVYRGNTYDYEFTHHARRKPSGSAGCDSWGATIRAVIGLVSGTGTVSSYHQGSDDDAAWLNRRWNNVHPGEEGHPAEFTVSQADDSTLVGRESTCYETERRHPTETHDMSVSIPANAPRGSTFKVAFFRWSGTRCDGTKVDTRSGLGDRGWSAGALDENQVELGTVGTVTVAPVPDAAARPTIAWGPTRNSVRIEFEANDHDGSDFIVNYNVHLRRLQSNGTWTKWGGVGRVNHREGATLSTVVSGLQPSTRYQVRVSPRAQMWSGGQVFYGPNGPAVEFATHTELAPDPPTGLRAHQVFYNRAEVRWNAPGHVGVAPIARYTISARQQIGAGWSDWGWSANAGSGARSHTVTGYCSARGQSHCPAGSFVEFDPQRTYQIRVSARNQQGNTPRDSAQSEIVEIQTIAVLTNAPGGPRLSQLTHNSVRVSWDAPTNDGAERIHNWGIDVRRLKPDNTWTDWSRVNAGANARTIVRTGLEPDSDYQVRVFPRARMRPGGRDHYGPATDSLDFRTRTEVPSAPDAPTLSNPQTMPQSIDVSWTAPDWAGASPVNDYSLHVLVGSAWKASHPEATGTATSLTLTGWRDFGQSTVHALEPGVEYAVRVAAANQQGAGPYSDTSSFVETLPGAPNAPAAPTVSEIGSGSVKVTWSAPDPYTGATPIVQYDLQVFDGSAWHESRPEARQGTGLTINGYLLGGGGGSRDLEPSTDYQVRVRARNGILDGDGNVTGHRLGIWSEATAFRTAPGAPTGLIAIPQDGGAWLLWTPPAASGPGDVSHYTVEYADNAAFTGSQTVDSVSLAAGERVVPLDWALLPSGLETGDRFRLLFVSTQPTGGDDGPIGSAEASDIAVYNDFAQRRAAAGHAAIAPYADGFRALVTTTGINAVVNTGTTWSNSDRGVAIYWLNGDKAADDYGDFYDDSWDSNAPKNESGGDSTFHDRVWTGSTHSGGRVFGQEAGQDSVSYGNPTSSGGELRASTATTGGLTRGTIYGLSPVLVVGPEEPAETVVTGLTNDAETHFRVRAVRRSGGTDFPGDWSGSARATPSDGVDYDADDDGLIEIANLAQLNAVRWDMRGRGEAAAGHELDYLAAFPVPLEGMGCPPVVGDTGGCRGYELAADLDFGTWDSSNHYWNGGEGWLPIGSLDNDDDRAVYGGVFDGNGRTIANLYVNRGSYHLAGLFDGIGYGGVVRDLGLPGADVTGNNNVGALSGLNSGTVLRSWSTGGVTAQGVVAGGLVGVNGNGDLIGESWSAATVAGNENTGGLVGETGER